MLTYKVTVEDNGNIEWYLNDKLHCEHGPAYIGPSGTQVWYVNDKRHRTDGPAIVWDDGSQEWWLNDTQYRDNKFFQKAAKLTDEEMVILIIKYGDVT